MPTGNQWRALVTRKQQGHWLENFASGAAASVAAKLVLQPFDTTKTLLQASKEVRGSYGTLAECLVGVVKTKGLGGLYTGFIASLAVSAPSTAVFAAGYEFAKNALEKAAVQHPLGGILQPCAPILASSFGNVFSSVVRVPPEVVKQQVQTGMYRNIVEATKMIWVNNGLAGFYQGYSSMVLRDIPYAALQFMTFEALTKRKEVWLKNLEDARLIERTHKQYDVAISLCIGAIAGAVASTLTTPLDVVKTRVMTERNLTGLVEGGMRSTAKKIWMEEGLSGFGRGMAPRVLYKVPASAIFLLCYEVAKNLFRGRCGRIQIPTRPVANSSAISKEADVISRRGDLERCPKPL